MANEFKVKKGLIIESGDFNTNGNSIISPAATNLTITPGTTGSIVLDGLNWPQADGTADQVLKTNGAGQLAWATPAAGGGATGYLYSGTITTPPTGTGEDTLVIGDGAVGGSGATGIVIGKNATQGTGNYNILMGDTATIGSNRQGCTVLGAFTTVAGGDNTAIGIRANCNSNGASSSVALGADSVATGSQSLAVGYSSSAIGLRAISIGNGSAVGQDAVSIGNNTVADTQEATAIGNGCLAGYRSVSIGKDVDTNTKTNAVAVGYSTYAASYAVAIGDAAAAGDYSVAIGDLSSVTFDQDVGGVAIGRGSSVSSTNPNSLQIKVNNATTLDMSATGTVSVTGTTAQVVAPNYTTITLPTGTTGGIVYDSTTVTPKYYNGSAWATFDGAVAKEKAYAVVYEHSSPSDTAMGLTSQYASAGVTIGATSFTIANDKNWIIRFRLNYVAQALSDQYTKIRFYSDTGTAYVGTETITSGPTDTVYAKYDDGGNINYVHTASTAGTITYSIRCSAVESASTVHGFIEIEEI